MDLPKRKPTRLKGYDYSAPGAYFITICKKDRENLLSKIIVGTPVPANSLVAGFISTFKRFCNREIGKNVWQSCSNDHIIRGKRDYEKIWEYIDTNVERWDKDCFYS